MAKKDKKHPLDALAEGDPLRVIALMLWQDRRREPDMYRRIEEKDIQGFDDCMAYQKATPTVKIFRPQGIPAQAAVPATHKRRPVAAREATPAKPFVTVVLVDQSGNAIKPVENNESDFDTAQDASKVRKARDQAADLAQRLIRQSQTGEYSTSDMMDAANALMTLSRA